MAPCFFAVLGCAQVLGVEKKDCHNACASATAQLVCDENGDATEHECGADLFCSDGKCQSAIVSIAASPTHTCAAKIDGSVWWWGPPLPGFLVDWASTPTSVPLPAGKRAIAVTTGLVHDCAILVDVGSTDTSGSIYCWGINNFGQLGIPVADLQSHFIARVPNLPSQMASIEAGFGHTCARSVDGKVYCWGANYLGQSGQKQDLTCAQTAAADDIDKASTLPGAAAPPGPAVAFPAGAGPIEELATKVHTSCARTGGSLYCWGSNCGEGPHNGYLGNKCVTPEPTDPGDPAAGLPLGGQLQLDPSDPNNCYLWKPTQMAFPGDLMVSGVAGVGLSFASTFMIEIAQSGSARVFAWGANQRGQLGAGSKETALWSPASVKLANEGGVTTLLGATDLIPSVGSDFCALTTSGLLCWGANDCGELRWGPDHVWSISARPSMMTIPRNDRGRLAIGLIARGDDYACAVAPGPSDISCWGREEFLGDARSTSGGCVDEPVQVTWGPR
jgi:alpha-tubulin suppressor-like RCC1 family protein